MTDDYKSIIAIENSMTGVRCFCYEGFTKGICQHTLALKLVRKEVNNVYLLEKKKARGEKEKQKKRWSRKI